MHDEITEALEALDMTLEYADASGEVRIAYSTLEELRDLLAWAENALRQREEA